MFSRKLHGRILPAHFFFSGEKHIDTSRDLGAVRLLGFVWILGVSVTDQAAAGVLCAAPVVTNKD
jgi:hypothetical protein